MALEAALTEELAPDGALQGLLGARIAAPLGGSSVPSASRPSCFCGMPGVIGIWAWP